MLILDADQVQYYQVSAEIAGQSKQASGLTYQGNVFIKVKSYTEEELDLAIKECREQYLDNQNIEIPTLIVKEKNAITLWIEDNRFKPLKPAESVNDTPSKIEEKSQVNPHNFNLIKVADQMRGEQGVKIKTRRDKFKLYHHCFLGNEAVDWLVENLKISRTEAVNVGKKLIDKKIIHHISDEHSFKDEQLYYRFYQDENKSIWTDKII
ncbi:pleckstrin/ G-protein interacting- domain protein [Stanieria cyanosphaera PCC 7437]|uniref:Pleckstrin/ G-protein interacting-domain protein n=1 Tax=Stanieria cyanosphaera (strain ATCC 29371 / PCC 7437) TaxID=111780 RepID=K9XT37_STAC7|nr:DEP domain-containing protein [Stanieria cyanosphaera]AFZ35241.1 pleckstrin/ G-protein interacting- domain protein [Stanieria cyanosphaera PCC 7437]